MDDAAHFEAEARRRVMNQISLLKKARLWSGRVHWTKHLQSQVSKQHYLEALVSELDAYRKALHVLQEQCTELEAETKLKAAKTQPHDDEELDHEIAEAEAVKAQWQQRRNELQLKIEQMREQIKLQGEAHKELVDKVFKSKRHVAVVPMEKQMKEVTEAAAAVTTSPPTAETDVSTFDLPAITPIPRRCAGVYDEDHTAQLSPELRAQVQDMLHPSSRSGPNPVAFSSAFRMLAGDLSLYLNSSNIGDAVLHSELLQRVRDLRQEIQSRVTEEGVQLDTQMAGGFSSPRQGRAHSSPLFVLPNNGESREGHDTYHYQLPPSTTDKAFF